MSKDQLRTEIGENIRTERIACCLSLDELSELLELTPGFLGMIERGLRGTTPYTLFKLSDIFDQPIDHFFRCNQEEPFNIIKALHEKISVLTANFTERELIFVISMIKGISHL